MSTNYNDSEFNPSDWISQAEAARLRNVSRQAIAKLVRKGRIRSLEIGGRTLVNRTDVQSFLPKDAGRPKSKRNHNDQSTTDTGSS